MAITQTFGGKTYTLAYEPPAPRKNKDWEQPENLIGWYNKLESRQADEPIDPWLAENEQDIRTAVDYYRYQYKDRPWWQWEAIRDPYDPVMQYLRAKEPPPPTAFDYPTPEIGTVPGQQQKVEQAPTPEIVADTPAKGVMGAIMNNYPSLAQGFMGGLMGAAVGGIPGGIVGALGSGYLAKSGYTQKALQEAPSVAKALMWLNYPAESLERAFGTIVLGYGLGAQKTKETGRLFGANSGAEAVGDFIRNLPSAWKAAHGTYEIGAGGLGEPAFTREVTGSDQFFYDAYEAWKNGEIKTIAEYDQILADKYGVKGMAGDLVANMIFDPLNLFGLMSADIIKGIAKVGQTTAKTVEQAKGMALLGKAAEQSGGWVEAFQKYGKWMQSGLGITTGEISKLGPVSRWLGGVTKAGEATRWEKWLYGVSAGGTAVKYAKPAVSTANRIGAGLFNGIPAFVIGYGVAGPIGAVSFGGLATIKGAWRFMTPASRAIDATDNMAISVARLIDTAGEMVDDPDIAAEQAIKYVKSVSNNPHDLSVELSMASLDSPEASVIPLALKDLNPKLDTKLKEWKASKPQRTVLSNIAKVLDMPEGEVLVEIGKTEDADALLGRYVEVARQSADPAAKGIVAAYDSGQLTGGYLKNMLDRFSRQPYDWETFRGDLFNMVMDHGDKWSADYFGVKPGGKWVQTGRVIKAAQSAVLLGFNPSYFMQNAVNNAVTMAFSGAFGLRTPHDVDMFWDMMGIRPPRLYAALGAAQTGDVAADIGRAADKFGQVSNREIRRASRGSGLGESAANALGKLTEIAPMTNLSNKAERLSSVQAYTQATAQAYARLKRIGQGIDPIDPRLQAMLRQVEQDNNLPTGAFESLIYSAIMSGNSRTDIERHLFGQVSKRQVDGFITRLAQESGFSEGTLRSTLEQVGILGRLRAELSGDYTPEQVRKAFQNLRVHMMDYFDDMYQDEVRLRSEWAANKVASEGIQAVVDIVYDQSASNLERRLQSVADWDTFWDEIGGDSWDVRNAAFRDRFDNEQRTWARQWARQASGWLGISRALGDQSPSSRAMLTEVGSLSDLWKGAHDERMRLYNEHFNMQFDTPDARKAHWETTKANVRKVMDDAYARELEINRRIGQKFADLLATYVDQTRGTEYAAYARKAAEDWYNNYVATLERIGKETSAFYRSLDGKSPKKRQEMWRKFNDEHRIPRFVDTWKANTEGVTGVARSLSEEPPPAVMPEMPPAPPSGGAPGAAAYTPKYKEGDRVVVNNKPGEVVKVGSSSLSDEAGNVVPGEAFYWVQFDDNSTGIFGEVGTSYDQMVFPETSRPAAPQPEAPKAPPPPTPEQLRSGVRKVAQEFGISTVDASGRRVSGADRHILNIIKKYGGEEAANYGDLAEVNPEVATRAFEARQAAHAVEPEKVGVYGSTTSAISPDAQQTYEFKYRVVELDDLITSHDDALQANPEYPQELQPRQRERMAGELQVEQIASTLNPDAILVDTHRVDSGPMIIGPDRVVESGNGRAIALRRARNVYPDNYAAYKAKLIADAQTYGLDPAQIEGMTNPVLVRERTSNVSRADFAAEANQRATLDMSPVEIAVQDATNLPTRVIEGLEVGEAQTIDQALRSPRNSEIVRSFVGSLPAPERAAILDSNGQINAAGLERIKRALFAATYQGDAGRRLLALFTENADPGVKNLQDAMLGSLAQVSRMEAAAASGRIPGNFSIADDIAKAADVFARLKRDGTVSISDYLKQISMFDTELDANQAALLRFMDQNSRSPKALRNFLLSYADNAMKQAPEGQASMFGDVRSTKGELLNVAASEAGKAEGITFTEEQAGQVYPAQPTAGREGLEAASREQPREEPPAEVQPKLDEIQQRETIQTKVDEWQDDVERFAPPEKAEAIPTTPETQASNNLISFGADDIDYAFAERAYSGVSFEPEARAKSVQRDYVQHMQDVHDRYIQYADTPEKLEALAQELERYKEGYLKRLNAYLSAKSRVVSSFIAGPSKFPVERMRKRTDIEDARLTELLEWSQRAQKAIKQRLAPEAHGVRVSQSNAAELIQTKIDRLEKLQATMKAANAVVRKNIPDDEKIAELITIEGISEDSARKLLRPDYAGRTGFASYELSNNNAEIRRLKGRLTEAGRLQERAAETTGDLYFDGGRITDNAEAERIQIFFDAKPDQGTIDRLKRNGFKWSPSNKAWQRQRTENAFAATRQLFPDAAARQVEEGIPEAADEFIKPPIQENDQPPGNTLFQGQPSAIPLRDMPTVRQSRESVRQLWKDTGRYADDELDAGMAVLDAFALQQSKWTGLSPREWYARAFGGVTTGEMPAGALQQGQPWYYSTLTRTIEGIPQRTMTVDQLKAYVTKGGVKADELKWSGWDEWIAGKQGKITKQEALDFVRENQVEIEEVTRGATLEDTKKEAVRKLEGAGFDTETARKQIDGLSKGEQVQTPIVKIALGDDLYYRVKHRVSISSATKYATYTLPGGSNYRELLITLPRELRGTDTFPMYLRSIGREDANYAERQRLFSEFEKIRTHATEPYQSPHWNEPNVLAHVRFDDRVDADGKRVLFVEEVQSDWHQAGREKGYKGELTPDEKELQRLNTITWNSNGALTAEERARLNELEARVGASLRGKIGGVPPAPFSKTWPTLAMKRIIRWASENGYDRVAWTTGAQQAERYNLANTVDAVDWVKHGDDDYSIHAFKGRETVAQRSHIDADELAQTIGQDAAKRIIDGSEPNGSLTGEALQVGGEGMRTFYDAMLPSEVQKYVKKWGARVGETKLKQYEYLGDAGGVQMRSFQPPEVNEGWNYREVQGVSVHSFDITPEMRNSAMAGQPLFQGPKGAVQFGQDARAMVYAFQSADMSTFMHESAHIFRRWLPEEEMDVVTRWVNEQGAQVEHQNGRWTGDEANVRRAEELYARGFEEYIRDGAAPTPELATHFQKLKVWLAGIYARLRGNKLVNLNDEMRAHFDRILGGTDEVSVEGGRVYTGAEESGAAGQYPNWVETDGGPSRLLGDQTEGTLYQASDGVNDVSNQETVPAAAMPIGTVDKVYGGAQPPTTQMMEDAWSDNISPTVDRLERMMLGPEADLPTNALGHLSDDQMRDIRKYLGKVYGQLGDVKMASIKWGENRRDYSLLNYSKRYEWDDILSTLLPYEFWYTRSALNWALRSMEHPAILSNYARLRDFTNRMSSDENFPTRLKNKMRFPYPYLTGNKGPGVYFDPLRQLIPVDQLVQPLDRLYSQQSQVERRAGFIIQDWLASEQISPAQQSDPQIIAKANSMAKQQLDAEISNPMDFISMMSGPALPFQWAYQVLRGTPENIGQLPVTRTIQSVSALAGVNQGRGVNVEGALRRKLGLPERSEYSDYLYNRELARMTVEGLIDSKTAQRAMIDRTGPEFIEAQRRVEQLGAKRNFLSVIAFDTFPESEAEIRSLRTEYQAALDAQFNKGQTTAINDFFNKYPEYEAQTFVSKEPEAQMRQWLKAQVWEKYMNLPDLQKKVVREQLGDLFNLAFLDKETRSYDTISTPTLQLWAKQLGGDVPQSAPNLPQVQGIEYAPETASKAFQAMNDERDKRFPNVYQLQSVYFGLPEGPARDKFLARNKALSQYWEWRDSFLADNPSVYPYVIGEDNKLAGADPAIQQAIYQYKTARAKNFPGIFDIQTGYFNLSSVAQKRAYLQKHPDLKNYWTWQKTFLANNPETIPYIKSAESIAEAVLGEGYQDIYGVGQSLDASKFQPALIRQLLGYYTAGQNLGSGARMALKKEWEAAGRPGMFDDWLNITVRYAITGQ